MKKLLYVFSAVMFISCTQNIMTKNLGGHQKIELAKGQKLVELTFKDDNLWILTEPMDSDYVPKTKHFYETSSFGVWEGDIEIIESR